MARWKRGETDFEVGVYKRHNRDGSPSRSCSLPKPVSDLMGDPDAITFRITRGGRITVEAAPGRVRRRRQK